MLAAGGGVESPWATTDTSPPHEVGGRERLADPAAQSWEVPGQLDEVPVPDEERLLCELLHDLVHGRLP